MDIPGARMSAAVNADWFKQDKVLDLKDNIIISKRTKMLSTEKNGPNGTFHEFICKCIANEMRDILS